MLKFKLMLTQPPTELELEVGAGAELGKKNYQAVAENVLN